MRFIRHLGVRNFKSFQSLDVDFSDVNVVVGPNAAGKSNLIAALRFLRDIPEHGLVNAIWLQGGPKLLHNTLVGSGAPTRFHVVSQTDLPGVMQFGNRTIHVTVNLVDYEFAIRCRMKGNRVKVESETMRLTCDFREDARPDDAVHRHDLRTLGSGELVFTRTDAGIQTSLDLPEPLKTAEAQFERAFAHRSLPGPDALIIEQRHHLYPLVLFSDAPWASIGIYDFDPRLARRSVPLTGEVSLAEDASNLALALRSVLAGSDARDRFLRLLGMVVPFIEDVRVSNLSDRSLYFSVHERFIESAEIPAALMSDGTVRVAALILALYFEHNSLTIIEEPDRSLHPALLARIVSLFYDSAIDQQVLVTTHSPEFVKHVRLDDVLVLSRDSAGFTQVAQPTHLRHVMALLDNDIPIDELFAKGMLTGG